MSNRNDDMMAQIAELPDKWRADELASNRFVSGYSCAAELDAIFDARIEALLEHDEYD